MTGVGLKSAMMAALLGMAALLPPASAATPAQAARAVAVEDPYDMTMGSETAPVTLILYASVTCGHCVGFIEDVLPNIEAKYIDTGKVRYVFREFITPSNAPAAAGALLARCSGRDNYFHVINAMVHAQGEAYGDGTTTNALGVFVRVAHEVGLSTEEFQACVTDEQTLDRLQDKIELYMTEHNVRSVPTIYINGKKFEGDTGDLAEFEKAFADLGVE